MDDIQVDEPIDEEDPKPIVDDEEEVVDPLLTDEPIPLGQLKKKDLIDPDLVDEDEEDEEEDEEEVEIENNGMWEE